MLPLVIEHKNTNKLYSLSKQADKYAREFVWILENSREVETTDIN